MKFIAVSLNDYHQNQMEDATVSCRVKTIAAKTMERAKDHLRTHEPGTSWLLSRCDTVRNIVYGHESID